MIKFTSTRTPEQRPIRIAHVALQLETGGMERLLVEHARHVDRDRIALHFVALGTRGAIADEIEACGWPVTAVNAGPGVRPGTGLRLTRLFREAGIDVVHTHNTKPLLYAGPAAKLAGVRGVVHTRHGQRHGASPRQNLLFRLASGCADQMVCVSEDGANLCRHEGIEEAKIRTIVNGIDTRRFAFTGPNPTGPALFVGRLSTEKDLPTLLRAAAIIAKQRPGFRMRMAGTGARRDELVAQAANLGLSKVIEFVGEVRDVPALMRDASMFVLSSLTEGVPLTVLEAMACGLPVVATRVGGTAEAVAEPATGLLVEPARAADLAAAMLKVLDNADLAKRMGVAGRQRVERLFDVRSMVAKYETLYAELLDTSVARAA